MPVTIAMLMPLLQARLNDTNDGQWTRDDKRRFINSARKRTVVRAKCYHTLQSVAIAAGTAEYSVDPVFEPLAVRLGDDLLTRVPLSSMPVIAENWDAVTADRPTKWTSMYGAHIRICPTPAAAYLGAISSIDSTPTAGGLGYQEGDVLAISGGTGGEVRVVAVNSTTGEVTTLELASIGYGYGTGSGQVTYYPGGNATGTGSGCTVNVIAVAGSDEFSVYGPSRVTDLATDDTEITEIPFSHCEEVLLLAAEEEARRARPTMTGSVEVANLLHALWAEQCQDIKRVLGVVG